MPIYDFSHTVSYFIKRITQKTTHSNATLELLKSSILVAISGALRVHIASLLLQTHSSFSTCLAGGLVIYSVYTLDRMSDSKEDIINRTELNGSKKEVGLIVALLTFILGGYLLSREGRLEFAFLPLLIGFLYSKGIKIGKFSLKLKGGLGAKNVVVGLIWGISTVGVAGIACKNQLALNIVFLFFGVKLFINSAIYDFKDIKGDTLAGIKTLPARFGAKNTRNLLIWVHSLSHFIIGISVFVRVLAFEPIIVIYSWICGLICIQYYTKSDYQESLIQKIERIFLIDLESAVIVGLRAFSGMFC